VVCYLPRTAHAPSHPLSAAYHSLSSHRWDGVYSRCVALAAPYFRILRTFSIFALSPSSLLSSTATVRVRATRRFENARLVSEKGMPSLWYYLPPPARSLAPSFVQLVTDLRHFRPSFAPSSGAGVVLARISLVWPAWRTALFNALHSILFSSSVYSCLPMCLVPPETPSSAGSLVTTRWNGCGRFGHGIGARMTARARLGGDVFTLA
jgi:hypothetical protein